MKKIRLSEKNKAEKNAQILDIIISDDIAITDSSSGKDVTIIENNSTTITNTIEVNADELLSDDINLKIMKKYYYSTLSQICFEYTNDERMSIYEQLYGELDNIKLTTVDEYKTAAKNILYNNIYINLKNVFKIILLYQVPPSSVKNDIEDNNNDNNNNYYVSFYLALNVLYQIFSSSKISTLTNELIIFENQLTEKKQQKNKNKKAEQKKFISEFKTLLLSLLSVLNNIKNEDNNDEIKLKFIEASINYFNDIMIDQFSSDHLNNKSSKKILDIILFFIEYYNNNNKKYNLLLMEKNDDVANGLSLCQLRKMVLSSSSTNQQIFEYKVSSNKIKKFLTQDDDQFDCKCILVYDETTNSLQFYEYVDFKTIWTQLDLSFNFFWNQSLLNI